MHQFHKLYPYKKHQTLLIQEFLKFQIFEHTLAIVTYNPNQNKPI